MIRRLDREYLLIFLACIVLYGDLYIGRQILYAAKGHGEIGRNVVGIFIYVTVGTLHILSTYIPGRLVPLRL